MWVNQTIAGCCISIQATEFEIRQEPDPAYDAFLTYSPPDLQQVTCRGKLQVVTDFSFCQKHPLLFNSGESWQMYSNGTTRFITLQLLTFIQPIWALELDERSERCTFFLNANTLKDESPQQVSNPLHYPLDQILLMYHLQQHHACIIHSAGIEFQQRGWIFAGVSGGGKTTISRLFEDEHRATILSDDRMILHRHATGFDAFGTPWPGEGGFAHNRSMPLEAILFLEHGTENKLLPLTEKQALAYLLRVISVPWFDAQGMSAVLEVCDALLQTIPAFQLQFVPEKNVIDFLAHELT